MSRFGAAVSKDGVAFRIWTDAPDVELVINGYPRSPCRDFTRRPDGVLELHVPDVGPGARYGYRINGQGPFPDPASRFQPDGVHALSEVIDPAFPWTDAAFRPAPWSQTIIYELHLGTFTPEGTLRAAERKLPALHDLGITAIELMPVAAAPGTRNWGYDGVSLFAPSANYGRPEDLRRFVNSAHDLGLSVYLDVVYNHLGPDGAYHGLFHPHFYSPDTHTPWGSGLNFDGPGHETARAFFIDNGRHWITEYHIDGFRLDATHAIVDRTEPHFLAEFTGAMHDCARALGRSLVVIAEDARNLASLLRPREHGGYGLDAVWADDFHHQVRRALTGDASGYFSDFTGDAPALADSLNNGWFYRGQHSNFHHHERGTPTDGLASDRFVICIDNHDQSGNRAHGDRMQQRVTPEQFRAASALLLLAPQTPLLFMGQEWASSSPFQFFTDHNPELGRLVTEGRKREFAHFPEFVNVPDPQDPETFLRSKLNWEERTQPRHAEMLRWYGELIRLRRRLRAEKRTCRASAHGDSLHLEWRRADGDVVLVVIKLAGDGSPGCEVSHLPSEVTQ